MDKFNFGANTGEITITHDFCKLPGYKKVIEELSLCEKENA